MIRTAKSRKWWEEEAAWIEHESKKAKPMNAFGSYCAMQADFASKDGYPDIADQIRKFCLCGD